MYYTLGQMYYTSHGNSAKEGRAPINSYISSILSGIHWKGGFFLLINLFKFKDICSSYPFNVPADVGHATPYFELGHNLCVCVYIYIK